LLSIIFNNKIKSICHFRWGGSINLATKTFFEVFVCDSHFVCIKLNVSELRFINKVYFKLILNCFLRLRCWNTNRSLCWLLRSQSSLGTCGIISKFIQVNLDVVFVSTIWSFGNYCTFFLILFFLTLISGHIGFWFCSCRFLRMFGSLMIRHRSWGINVVFKSSWI